MSEPNQSKKERREAARAQRVEAERKAAAADQRKRRLSLLGGVVALAAIVVVAAILISSSGDSGSQGAAADPASDVVGVTETNAMFDGIPQKGMVLGTSTASATLHQAEDPQCPVCKSYSETTLPAVLESSVRPGTAKVQLSMFPFIGDDSARGALFTVAAARQNRAFQALELIYRNQGTENSGYMTDAYLRKIAGAAGLDVNEVMADMKLKVVNDEVSRQTKYVQDNGATGTPTLWSQAGSGKLQSIGNFQDAAGISSALKTAAVGS